MTWTKRKDNSISHLHTGSTIYECDGYRIWKGKYQVRGCIYSADEWHLQRLFDNQVVCSFRTAKECKENFEYYKNLYLD